MLFVFNLDPTVKPSKVFRQEVDRVRDELSDEQKIGFDLVIPVSEIL